MRTPPFREASFRSWNRKWIYSVPKRQKGGHQTTHFVANIALIFRIELTYKEALTEFRNAADEVRIMDAKLAAGITVTDYHIVELLYQHGALSAPMLRLLLDKTYSSPLSARTIVNRLYKLQKIGLIRRLKYDWKYTTSAPTLWGLDNTKTARNEYLGIVGREHFDKEGWRSATGIAHRYSVPAKRGYLEACGNHDHVARNFMISLLLGDGLVFDCRWPPDTCIEFQWIDGRTTKIICDLEIFALLDRPRRILVEIENQAKISRVDVERFRKYLRLAFHLHQHPRILKDSQSEAEMKATQASQATQSICFVVRDSRRLLPIYLDVFRRAMDSKEFGSSGLKLAQQFTWLLTDSINYEMLDYTFTPLPSVTDEIWIDMLRPEKGNRALY